MTIDLHADALAIHEAKINALFNVAVLDAFADKAVTRRSIEKILAKNAKKFFTTWGAHEVDFYSEKCFVRAVHELAERNGLTDADQVEYFALGFDNNVQFLEHSVSILGGLTEEGEAQIRSNFEQGKLCAEEFSANGL